jgi:cyclopropane fatty-acyl-phospholipid synthase-like methyltransferase
MMDDGVYMMSREVAYPLNVFLHVLTREEGEVAALHYGFFESPDEAIVIGTAQERSTSMLIERLPQAPARLLDVGAGLGTLVSRLIDRGYDAAGITPDAQQVALAHARDARLRSRVICAAFETFTDAGVCADAGLSAQFDALIFQESSQYIDPPTLWRAAAKLTARVLVLDEFLLRRDAMDTAAAAVAAADASHASGHVHSIRPLDEFLACAEAAGFRVAEERDLSRQAAPTIDYFLTRIPHHREALCRELGVSEQQIADLLASGTRYRDFYRDGVYGYRLLDLQRLDAAKT